MGELVFVYLRHEDEAVCKYVASFIRSKSVTVVYRRINPKPLEGIQNQIIRLMERTPVFTIVCLSGTVSNLERDKKTKIEEKDAMKKILAHIWDGPHGVIASGSILDVLAGFSHASRTFSAILLRSGESFPDLSISMIPRHMSYLGYAGNPDRKEIRQLAKSIDRAIRREHAARNSIVVPAIELEDFVESLKGAGHSSLQKALAGNRWRKPEPDDEHLHGQQLLIRGSG